MRKKQKKIVLWVMFCIVCLSLIATLSSRIYSGISPDNYEIPQQVRDDRDIVREDSKTVRDDNVRDTNYEIPGQARDDGRATQDASKQSGLASFEKSATFKIGDTELETSISENTSVYNAMKTLTSEGKITFEGKNYPGLGFFVTQVGDLTSGDGKNLIYYINDKEASLGVSSYIIKEGDIIEWKLK